MYEQRRQESLKIINETGMYSVSYETVVALTCHGTENTACSLTTLPLDTKRRNIEELLTHIEERLEELEEEKEELKLYQEHDRRRRCLEYTIYSREQKDINDALEEVSALPASQMFIFLLRNIRMLTSHICDLSFLPV